MLKLGENESRGDELEDTDSRALLLTTVVLGDAETTDDTLDEDDELITAVGVIENDADTDERIVREMSALSDIALEELRDTVEEMVELSRGGRDLVVEIEAVAELDMVIALALTAGESEIMDVTENNTETVAVD